MIIENVDKLNSDLTVLIDNANTIFENYETKYIKSDPSTIYEKIEKLEEEIKTKGTSIKNILSSIAEIRELAISETKAPLWFEQAQDEEQQALVYFQKMGYSFCKSKHIDGFLVSCLLVHLCLLYLFLFCIVPVVPKGYACLGHKCL